MLRDRRQPGQIWICRYKKILTMLPGEPFVREASSLATILHRMEEQDMVKRVVKKENRRNTYVYLTPHGKELARKVQNSFAKIERELFRGMDEKEVEIFMNVFRKINEKLTE